MIPLYGQHLIAASLDDLLGGSFFSSRNRSDLLSLFFIDDLGQAPSQIFDPHADSVQRPQSANPIIRPKAVLPSTLRSGRPTRPPPERHVTVARFTRNWPETPASKPFFCRGSVTHYSITFINLKCSRKAIVLVYYLLTPLVD